MKFRSFLQANNPDFLNENFQIPKFEDAHIIYLYRHTKSMEEIKNETGMSYGSIYRVLERNGIKPYRRQNPLHDSVAQYHWSGMGIKEISNLTNYTEKTVRNIIKSLNDSNIR